MAILPKDVRDVTGSELNDNVIRPFITAADAMLNTLEDSISAFTTEQKNALEIYLAAHLLTSSAVGQDSALIAKESINGKYSVEYVVSKADGKGILSTPYGQIANSLSNGYLAELDKQPIAFETVGNL